MPAYTAGSKFPSPPSEPKVPDRAELPPRRLAGRRILVVEDEFLLANNLADMLRQCGAEVLGPLGWMDEVIAFLDADAPSIHAVVLDLNLHGTRTYEVADRLVDLGVPFVFATGYSLDAIDDAYRHHPRCEKPLNIAILVATLAAM